MFNASIDKNAVSEKIRNFLEGNEISYHYDNENDEFTFTANLGGMAGTIHYRITINDYYYYIEATSPFAVDVKDEKKTYEMLRLIQMLNYKFTIREFGIDLPYRSMSNFGLGIFALDLESGSIILTQSVTSSELKLYGDEYYNVILMAALAFDFFGDGILKLAHNDITAEDAVICCDYYKNMLAIAAQKLNDDDDNFISKEIKNKFLSKTSNADKINTDLFPDDN